MKKRLSFLLFFSLIFCNAQQNEFFKEAKRTFDKYEEELSQEFNKRMLLLTQGEEEILKKQYIEALSLLKEARNRAYTEALIKTKVALDLSLLENTIHNIEQKANEQANKEAIYPTGIQGLREDVLEIFNTDIITTEKESLSTLVTFVVEKNGQISNVKALGDHREFNKQAEITIYLLPNHFTPALKNGKPVRSMFKFPMKMRFE